MSSLAEAHSPSLAPLPFSISLIYQSACSAEQKLVHRFYCLELLFGGIEALQIALSFATAALHHCLLSVKDQKIRNIRTFMQI